MYSNRSSNDRGGKLLTGCFLYLFWWYILVSIVQVKFNYYCFKTLLFILAIVKYTYCCYCIQTFTRNSIVYTCIIYFTMRLSMWFIRQCLVNVRIQLHFWIFILIIVLLRRKKMKHVFLIQKDVLFGRLP